MKSSFLILFLILFSSGMNAQKMQTVFEKSQGLQTATYEEGIRFYRELAKQSPLANFEAQGLTDSGEPLHLFTISGDMDFDFSRAHEKGKVVLLINNAIHPGEPDGVEASMMLARNIVENPAQYRQWLDKAVIAIIPFYNVGGVLNRNSYSRVNQEGPEEYGFRGNARHYDLNRDFIKNDTRNARSFAEIFHQTDPDVFIDTHVSNGADYQYVLTIIPTQKDKLGGALAGYLENKMMPALYEHMAATGYDMTPYVNSIDETPESGIVDFLESPRYSTGYAALFHTIGFMPETHMLKPFQQRVEATYQFIAGVLNLLVKDGAEIAKLRADTKQAVAGQKMFALTWAMDTTKVDQFAFKGYEVENPASALTGQPRLQYNREKPYTKNIPVYHHFKPDIAIEKPAAYLIPQAWYPVIELLRLNGVQMETLPADTTLEVEVYYIGNYQTVQRPYEGHYLHHGTQVRKETKAIAFRKGDWKVKTDQWTNRYIVETLEPQAPDSYFNWNFFDSILQQKEHFSAYVFEDKAAALVAGDPELKKALEARKKEDPKFAADSRAQLHFVYRQSPYYEKEHLRYPVFRLMTE